MTRLSEYEERRKHAAKRRKRTSPFGTIARALKIDGHSCRLCPDMNVEYHHIVPRSQFGAHDDAVTSADNAMPLCHQHHQDHHTTTNRVPRRVMTDAELAFAVQRMGTGWVDRWYPS